MAAWDVFMSRVLVHVPGAPDPLVRQMLRDAAREFCQRTHAYVAWLACTQDAPPDQAYLFTLPDDTEIERMEVFTLAGKPLEIVMPHGTERDWTTYAASEDRGVLADSLVRFLVLGAAVTEAVQARVSLMPTPAAATCPDLLATRYLEVIAAGAASKLAMLPDTAFTKPEVAALQGAKFQAGIDAAIGNVFRGHTGRVPRRRPIWC